MHTARFWMALAIPGGAPGYDYDTKLGNLDRKHRAPGITEDMLDAMIDQRAHDHRCAGHLVRIVAFFAHGWLRIRCRQRLSLVWVVQKIKRGPRGPLHTARIWMASAIPGGAPGYDYDKEFGNNISHVNAQTSQRLRGT